MSQESKARQRHEKNPHLVFPRFTSLTKRKTTLGKSPRKWDYGVSGILYFSKKSYQMQKQPWSFTDEYEHEHFEMNFENNQWCPGVFGEETCIRSRGSWPSCSWVVSKKQCHVPQLFSYDFSVLQLLFLCWKREKVMVMQSALWIKHLRCGIG